MGFFPFAATALGILRAPNAYAPVSQTILTTTSGTLAAVSSGNACTGSFNAPPSGRVTVAVNLVAGVSAGNHCSFALAALGTVAPVIGDVITFSGSSAFSQVAEMLFPVTGLTPGTAYNFDLLFAVDAAATLSVVALGTSSTTPAATLGGPVTMTVQAA